MRHTEREENWLKKKKLAVQKSKFVYLRLLWLDVRSVEGRKEEKGEERKGKAIWPFVAEERREKKIRNLKNNYIKVCLNTVYFSKNEKFIIKINKKIIFKLLFTSQILYICLNTLFMSYEQCKKC